MALLWQFLTVRYNYRGEWSALFCTGTLSTVPPLVAQERPYMFPGVVGWDGQWYHAIAHDPFFERGQAASIHTPRLRYRRILIPAAAYLLAFGNDSFIDFAYHFVILLFFGLGGWWLARVAQAAGKPAVLGLAFLVIPASIASLDRSAVDVGLLCFCCGFALYTRYVENPRALYAVLLLAGLVRETGLLLTAAYCLWLLLQREFRRSAIFASAAVPAIAWYLFVNSRTPPYSGDGAIALPFSGVLHRLMHPFDYPAGPMAVVLHGADFLAAAGVLLAMLLAVWLLRRRRPDPINLAILFFALLGAFVWRPGDWLEALDYARILSPLLLFEAMDGLPLVALAPLAMAESRFALQMASQAFGILKGLG